MPLYLFWKTVNIFKKIGFLLVISLGILHGMEPTITMRLQYTDGSFNEQIWKQTDFDKIALFKDMSVDTNSTSFNLDQEHSHITHDYLQDLIKGNCTANNVEQYVQDYAFFIGNDISLDKNGKHGPWEKSLKWQIFQEHKQFFDTTIHCNKIVRDFLYCDISKMSSFERQNIIITETVEVGLKDFTDNAIKLSICYPYLMHYQQIFQKNNEVMFLEFNNCIIENLELKTLFEYFPNLHTLMIKNCYIKEITDDDYSALLTRLKPKEPEEFITNKVILEILKKNDQKIDQKVAYITIATFKDKDPTKRDVALKHYHYSFFIDLEGTHIINSTQLITDHASIDHVPTDKKPILIKSLWHKQLIYQRLRYFAKSIIFFVLASALNIFFITKLLSFYKFSQPGLLPVLPILWIVVSCIIKPLITLALYESVTSQSIVIQ
jgi:hypothetical protein